MSNLRDLIEIRYENPVEGVSRFSFFILLNFFSEFVFLTFCLLFFFKYLMVDNEPVDRMQLRNELGVQIISSVSSLEIDYFSNSIL